MFRIRKLSNPFLDVNRRAMEKVRQIIRKQFPDIQEEKINELSEQMVDPLKYHYQATLIIAEDFNETIRGFALLLYMPDLEFCFLDFLAVSPGKPSSGIGGALYERLREEAEVLGAIGIFFECLPDDPQLYKDQKYLPQNKTRLAFYERYGARPIANTAYETPVKPDDDGAPYLVFDGLGQTATLPVEKTRKIIRAILERKYGDYCPEDYIQKVVSSIQDDPVTLRPFRYLKKEEAKSFKTFLPEKQKIFWVINDRHSIHHIREKGYVESPVRIASIEKELVKMGVFRKGEIEEFPEKFILDIHERGYVTYFKTVCKNLAPGKSVYPYVFPIRNSARPPKELSVRAGYYCLDTFTPLNQNAYLAARWGGQLYPHRSNRNSGRNQIGLRAHPASRSSCRTQDLWRILLLQQLRYRSKLPETLWQSSNPGYRLPSRQWSATDFLLQERCAHHLHSRTSFICLSLFFRF